MLLSILSRPSFATQEHEYMLVLPDSLLHLINSYILYFHLLWFLLQGKKIKVSSSQAKNRLFIGNVPRDWTPDDFKTAVEEVGPGVLQVDLMKV